MRWIFYIAVVAACIGGQYLVFQTGDSPAQFVAAGALTIAAGLPSVGLSFNPRTPLMVSGAVLNSRSPAAMSRRASRGVR